MASTTLSEIKQGQSKTYEVTFTRDGVVEDVSSGTWTATLKATKAGSALVTIADGSFDKSNGAQGKVQFTLTATNTSTDLGTLTADLTNFFLEVEVNLTAGTDEQKTGDLILPVRKAVLA